MKLNLLIATILSASSISYANTITNELTHHTFLLKNWNNGAEKCLQVQNYDLVNFEDCFIHDTTQQLQRHRAINQMVTYENNRIYFVHGLKPEEKHCLIAKDASTVMRSLDCNDDTSLFDIMPQSSDFSDQYAKFQIKSKAYNTCLATNSTGSAHLANCEATENKNEQYFATALKTPMIHLEVSNLNDFDLDISLEVQDYFYNIIYKNKAQATKNGQINSLYYPDFLSYMQQNIQTHIRANDNRWQRLNITKQNLRAADQARATINRADYNISFTKYASNSIKIGSAHTPTFLYTEDQNSLKPYINAQSVHSLPSGAAITLLNKENYKVTNNDFKNMLLKFNLDKEIEKGTIYESVRVLRANQNETFRITNEQGGLSWINETEGTKHLGKFTFILGQNLDQTPNFGLFNYKSTDESKWQRGAIFCDYQYVNRPKCAMLKTDYSARKFDFAETQHWHEFPFKAYKMSKVKKGELFYQYKSSEDEVELWYTKKGGNLNRMPSDKTENEEWFFMGHYHDLVKL